MPTTDAQQHGRDDPPLTSRSLNSDETSQPFPPLIIEDEPPSMQENIPPYSERLIDEVEEGDDGYGHEPENSYQDGKQRISEGEEEDIDFPSHYSFRASSPSGESSSSEDEPSVHEPPVQLNSSLLGPNAFTPPFYNRPPTPLPPSPSLTSLLRPTFSSTTNTASRPTTPESSDIDTSNDTEAAVAQSARDATTVPRVSPKVPTYEYYGFVLYLTSSLAFRTFISLPNLSS